MTGFTPELVERCARAMRPYIFEAAIVTPGTLDEQEKTRRHARRCLETSGIAELIEALERISVAERAPEFEPSDAERAAYWHSVAALCRETARNVLAKIGGNQALAAAGFAGESVKHEAPPVGRQSGGREPVTPKDTPHHHRSSGL